MPRHLILSFFLAQILAIALLAAAPSQAKQCAEKPVKANSNAAAPAALVVSPSNARSLARQAWDKRCAQLYSGVWCDPAMSVGKKYACNRAPNGVGGYKHICELSATPCRN